MNKDLKNSIDEMLDELSEGRGLCEYIIDVLTPAMYMNLAHAEVSGDSAEMHYFTHGMLSGFSVVMQMIDKQEQLSLSELTGYIAYCFDESKLHEED